MPAIETIRDMFIEESELAKFFNISPERMRDLRSKHNTGKVKFIEFIKPTDKCILYHLGDVIDYLVSLPKKEFENEE